MKKTATVLAFILVLFAAFCLAESEPQGGKHPFVPKEYPIEHTSVDELVSLSSGTPFAQGLFILSKFSNKFEKKIIIDPNKHKGNIGVDIENMDWKKAFEMILRANGLWFVSYDTYYEVIEPAVEVVTQKSKGETKKKIGLTPDTREVRIKATFFEGDRHFLHELGIDWTTMKSGSLNVDARSPGHQKIMDPEVRAALDTYTGGFGQTFGDVRVEALLDALESAEKGRIIATPEIVVMVGKSAKVLVGQEFAVNTRDFAGNIITKRESTITIPRIAEILLYLMLRLAPRPVIVRKGWLLLPHTSHNTKRHPLLLSTACHCYHATDTPVAACYNQSMDGQDGGCRGKNPGSAYHRGC